MGELFLEFPFNFPEYDLYAPFRDFLVIRKKCRQERNASVHAKRVGISTISRLVLIHTIREIKDSALNDLYVRSTVVLRRRDT